MAKVIYTYNNQILKSTDNEWYTEPDPPSDEVTIGTQIWKNKNLTINDGQGGIYTRTVNYGQGDVVEYYYTWEAALRVAASIPGWHLPTRSEWDTLAATVGGISIAGTKLKSTYGWESGGNGTDDYGFSVFPAGNYLRTSFFNLGTWARFWTANEDSLSTQAYSYFCTNTSNALSSNTYNKTKYSLSVRLVKDA